MDPKSFFVGWVAFWRSQAIFILRGVFLRRKCPKVFDGGQWSVAPQPFLEGVDLHFATLTAAT